MGIRDDMEMLKLMQQNSAMQQNFPGQSPMPSPMGEVPPWEIAQDGMMPMQQPMPPQIQQNSESQKRSPLEAGSRAAVDAAKHSLRLNDDENSRALGRALMGMMSGIGKSQAAGHGHGQGLAGNLAQINAGFEPALQAYDSERNRIMSLNHMLSTQQKAEAAEAQREERKMKKMSHEMDMAQKNLAINQGYFGLKKDELEQERRMAEEMSKAGAHIPLHTLSPMQHTKAMGDIKSYIDKGDGSIPGLQAIDTIERVLKNDKDVGKHWGTIALAVQRKDPGYVNQVLANKVPEKTRINAELLAKSLSVLGTSKFKGIPPKGLTAFAEKMLIEGSPSISMHPKSILKMVGPDKKYFTHNVEARDSVYENLEKGIYHIPKPMKFELEQDEEDENESPISQYTPDQAEVRKAEIRAQLGQ